MGIAVAMAYNEETLLRTKGRNATMARYRFGLLCLGVMMMALQSGPPPAAAAEPYDPWPGLVQDIFSNRAMADGAGVIAIEMPYRAEDAAIVPVTLRNVLPPGDG